MSDDDEVATASRSAADEALLALILEAFAAARDSGKDDWHRMYAGPLKNRILLLCGGKLPEPEWERVRFTQLLQRFPETLRVDFERYPPIVELLSQGRAESGAASPEVAVTEKGLDVSRMVPQEDDIRRWRLRRDLWDAVMGIRSPDRFVWSEGAAIRLPPAEAADLSDALVLPTLTGPELDAWQEQFARDLGADDPYAAVLESWGRGERPTSALPRHLQHLWYGRLKTLVRDRMEAWFEQHGITPPGDFVQIPDERERSGKTRSTPLRVLVERCIEAMTDEELAEIRIPAEVLLRLQP